MIELAIGGGLVALGWIMGRLSRRGPRPVKAPEPYCGCTHHRALHDGADVCHGTIERETRWDIYGRAVKWDEVPCPCQHYVGPVPAIEVWSPPILPEEQTP